MTREENNTFRSDMHTLLDLAMDITGLNIETGIEYPKVSLSTYGGLDSADIWIRRTPEEGIKGYSMRPENNESSKVILVLQEIKEELQKKSSATSQSKRNLEKQIRFNYKRKTEEKQVILVDLKQGIISMKGNAMTVHAELGIALKRYHEIESEHACKELADKYIDSLCENSKLSDEEFKEKRKKNSDKNSWIDKLAEDFAEEIMKGLKS